jgi:hypothetical protein
VGEGWLNACFSTNPWGPIYRESKRLECPYGLKGNLHLMKGSLVWLPLHRTRRHRTNATCTTHRRSSASFEAKLGNTSSTCFVTKQTAQCRRVLSHPVFKAKTRCSSYVYSGSSCHTYGQNVSTEYQCLYYIVSYYKNLLQVQKGQNSGMDPSCHRQLTGGFARLEEIFINVLLILWAAEHSNNM